MTTKPNGIYNTNIRPVTATREEVLNVLSAIARSLEVTLGPNGGNVLIEQMPESYLTKDGHTVLRNIRFSGNLENVVLSMVRKISSRMNRSVGDGTTSSIVLSYLFYQELMKIKDLISQHEMLTAIDYIVKFVHKHIDQVAVRWKEDHYKHQFVNTVAYISANNDERVAKIVTDAFASTDFKGNVIAKPGDQDYQIIQHYGYQLPFGYTSPVYINMPDNNTYVAYGTTNYFVSSVPLTSEHVTFLSNILTQNMGLGFSSLVILAPSYSAEINAFFEQNKRGKPQFNYVCSRIQDPNKSVQAQEDFIDLCNFLGAVPFDGYMTAFSLHEHALQDYGKDKIVINGAVNGDLCVLGMTVGNIVVSESETTITGKNEHQITVLNDIVLSLQKEAAKLISSTSDSESVDERVQRFHRRIQRLGDKGSATILVGGLSDVERKTQTYLVEDAIYAVESAIKHGVIPGCCSATLRSLLLLKSMTDENDKNYDRSIENADAVVLMTYAFIAAYTAYLKKFSGSDNVVVGENSVLSILDLMNTHEQDTSKKENMISHYKECLVKERTPLVTENELMLYDVRKKTMCPFYYWMPDRNMPGQHLPPLMNSAETDKNIIAAVGSIIGYLSSTQLFLSLNAISRMEDVIGETKEQEVLHEHS